MTAAITDFNQFTGLRAAANNNDPAALREVASQFEALFLQSMLKSMRDASMGDSLFGESDQMDMYQGMLDQQLSLEMASGKGVGLAEMLVRQLGNPDADRASQQSRAYPLSGSSRGHLAAPPTTRAESAISLSGASGAPAPGVSAPEQIGARAAGLQEYSALPGQATGPQKTRPDWSDPESFAREIWPHAERAGRRLNVAPEGIVAQAALETGWGQHVMPDERGESSFNLFGIKAHGGWQGEQVSRRTLEFENGVPRPQTARFRAYSNVAATFSDYAEFLADNPRYSAVSGHGDDVAGFANALQSAGYATDPQYANKITRVLESPTMQSVIRDLKKSQAQPIAARLSL